MSYRFTTGSVRRGDIYFEDDREGDPTYIDFGQDTITLRPSGSQILYAQSNAVGVGTTSPNHTLSVVGDISASIHISASAFYGDGSKLTGISGGGGGSSNITNMTHHRYNDGSGTGLEYIPWAGTSEQPSPSWISQGVAAYTGKLVKVLVRSSKSGGMGSTVVGIHIGTDGNSAFNSSAEETVTVNMASANTTGVFNFTNANHFAAGDVIAVSIDPTNAHGNVNVTCVWEYQST
jgi:hypothetical protein